MAALLASAQDRFGSFEFRHRSNLHKRQHVMYKTRWAAVSIQNDPSGS